MDRGRVGEDRGSKETDGCPLTMRGLSYHKEVRVEQMWSDMYRDHGEYILT
jgi:hypothetical protein